MSCLDFKSSSFAAIPDEGRADGDVVKAFGDPARVVWLKGRDASTKRIDFEFREMLRRVKPGDDLVVYYTGHGYLRRKHLFLATWNADIGNNGWGMERAFDQIRESFRGRTLTFFADCCAAGKLAGLAEGTSKPVGVLASSSGDEDVAMDWGFSSAVAKVLSGDRAVDANGDGVIAWPESVKFVQAHTGRTGTVFSGKGFTATWPVR